MKQFLLKHSLLFQAKDHQELIGSLDSDNDGFIDKTEVIAYIKSRLKAKIEGRLKEIGKRPKSSLKK